MASRQPDLVLDLLCDREALASPTITPIALALWRAGERERERTEAVLKYWIDDGQYVREVAAAIVYMSSAGPGLVEGAVAIALKSEDTEASTNLVEASARHFKNNEPFWRDRVFLPCIEVLRAKNNYCWIEQPWLPSDDDGIFANLSEEQCETLLDALIGLPSIDFQAESVLVAIAARFHTLVLDWFGERMELSKSKSVEDYSPVPFEIPQLWKALAPHTADILEVLRAWYDDPDRYEFWYVSHFLSHINPGLDEHLPEVLENMVDTSDSDTLLFIASMLAGFQGRETLFPLYRKALQSSAARDEIEQTIETLVFEAGIMSGHFGPAETNQKKIDLLNSWLEDDSERVSQFAKKRIAILERRVASETRRAQEEIALRRLEYGEDVVGRSDGELGSE